MTENLESLSGYLKYEDFEKKYVETENVDRGAFGCVSKCIDKTTKEIYALKAIECNTPQEVKQASLEIQCLVMNPHPHIVSIECFSIQEIDVPVRVKGINIARKITIIYLVMELGDRNLKHEIEDHLSNEFQLYEEEELYYIARSSIQGLAFLQKNKIAHSDVKPENLLFINNRLKICDFGSSVKLRSIASDQPVNWAGTTLYMSPQIMDAYQHQNPLVKHDPYKSDVFSLGLTLLYVASLLRVSGLNTDPNMIDTRINDLKEKRLYGDWFFKLLELMLSFDEKERKSFVQLEDFLHDYEGKDNYGRKLKIYSLERDLQSEREKIEHLKKKSQNSMSPKKTVKQDNFLDKLLRNESGSESLGNIKDTRKRKISIDGNIKQGADINYEECVGSQEKIYKELKEIYLGEKDAGKMEKILVKLWKQIAQIKDNELLMTELFELAGCIFYKWGDIDNAFVYHEKALSIRERKFGRDNLKTASSYYWIAKVYSQQGDFEHSYKFHKKVFKIRKSQLGPFDREIGEIFYWMAQDQLHMGNYEKAHYYAKNSLILKNFYQEEKKLEIAELNFTNGVILKYLSQFDEANKALDSAHSVFSAAHLTLKVGMCQLWKGVIKNLERDFDASHKFLEEAVRLLTTTNREKEIAQELSEAYYWMGINYSDTKSYEKAVLMHKKALDMRVEYLGHSHPLTVDSYYNLGIVSFDTGHYEEALKCHLSALEKKLSHYNDLSEEMVENHYWLAKCYILLGEKKTATAHISQARNILKSHNISEDDSCYEMINILQSEI